MMTSNASVDLKSAMVLFKAKSAINTTSSTKRSSISSVGHLQSKCVTSKLKFKRHVEN
jgi:hypothetical protein